MSKIIELIEMQERMSPPRPSVFQLPLHTEPPPTFIERLFIKALKSRHVRMALAKEIRAMQRAGDLK